ncbi:hypothetical protein E2C01_016876 [Portunus trituberculatus]|uniref:Uncharacterized protein n=1 Tax=Portunus trituberculatus TaxID=210409 RepID=A0A5B7DQ88_PORTR|nr:hypothetical protein [Portunus trituberculatus]
MQQRQEKEGVRPPPQNRSKPAELSSKGVGLEVDAGQTPCLASPRLTVP